MWAATSDLPLTLYHIQWKFRDEIRPRFGVMRGREFLMKDGYNFDLTKEDALHAYNRHLVSYLRTYERMGLQAIPMRADSARSAATTPMNSWCWPRPASPRCSMTARSPI